MGDEERRREMEQRSLSSLAGLDFGGDLNYDDMLTRALHPGTSGTLAEFIESAGGGWDKPAVPGRKADDGSKRTKKARPDQLQGAPGAKSAASKSVVPGAARAVGHQPPGGDAPDATKYGDANREPVSISNAAGSRSTACAIDSLRKMDTITLGTQIVREAALFDSISSPVNSSAPASLLEARRGPWMSQTLQQNTSYGLKSPTNSREIEKAPRSVQAIPREPKIKTLEIPQVDAGEQGGGSHFKVAQLADYEQFLALGHPSSRRLNSKEEQMLKQEIASKQRTSGQSKGTVNNTANMHDRFRQDCVGNHVGLPDSLNCLRLKDAEEYMRTPRTRIQGGEQHPIDFSNRIFHQVSQQERKAKQSTRVDIDQRVRAHLAKQQILLNKSLGAAADKHRLKMKKLGLTDAIPTAPIDHSALIGASPRRLPALQKQMQQHNQSELTASRMRRPLDSAQHPKVKRDCEGAVEDSEDAVGTGSNASPDDVLSPDLLAIFSGSESGDDDYDEIKRSLLLLSDRHAQGCSKPLAGGSSPSQLPGSPLQGRTTPMQTRVGGKAFAMRPSQTSGCSGDDEDETFLSRNRHGPMTFASLPAQSTAPRRALHEARKAMLMEKSTDVAQQPAQVTPVLQRQPV